MKKLYFVSTNGYDMVVSVDKDNYCKYHTEDLSYPYLVGLEMEERSKVALEFLKSIDSDYGWEDNCSLDELLKNNEVLAEIECDI